MIRGKSIAPEEKPALNLSVAYQGHFRIIHWGGDMQRKWLGTAAGIVAIVVASAGVGVGGKIVYDRLSMSNSFGPNDVAPKRAKSAATAGAADAQSQSESVPEASQPVVSIQGSSSEFKLGNGIMFARGQTVASFQRDHPSAKCYRDDRGRTLCAILRPLPADCPTRLKCNFITYIFRSDALEGFVAFYTPADWGTLIENSKASFGNPEFDMTPTLDEYEFAWSVDHVRLFFKHTEDDLFAVGYGINDIPISGSGSVSAAEGPRDRAPSATMADQRRPTGDHPDVCLRFGEDVTRLYRGCINDMHHSPEYCRDVWCNDRD